MRRSRLLGRPAACLVVSLCLALPGALRAQGVTTSAVSGIVTDTLGNPVEGATVLAIPTRIVYANSEPSGCAKNLLIMSSPST